jgi:hypothetical protein
LFIYNFFFFVKIIILLWIERSIYKISQREQSNRWYEFNLPNPFRILHIRNKYKVTTTMTPLQTTATSSTFHIVDNWFKCKREYNNNSNNITPPSSLNQVIKRFHKTTNDSNSRLLNNYNYDYDSSLTPIEEIILEAVDKTSKNNYSKLLILKRLSDGIYFCELSLSRPDVNSTSNTNSQVVFKLGLSNEASKYIEQYVNIFTEEGRRPVQIEHNLLEKTRKNVEQSLNNNNNSSQSPILMKNQTHSSMQGNVNV